MATTDYETRAAPKPGDPAPPLELVTGKDPSGRPSYFRLKDAVKNGPVIVAFFPGTFTSTCTSEMACFTRDWNQYERLGAQIIAVSVDSVPNQRAFAKHYDYRVPFGSDFEKQAIQDWGIASPFWWGTVSKRATFVVDRNGIIRHAEVQPNADLEPDYGALQAVLKDL